MKNTILSATISAIMVLFVQNYPGLFIPLVYIGIGYFVYLKMTIPIVNNMTRWSKEWDTGDHIFAVFMSMVWPVASIIFFIGEYNFFKKLYNFPSWRLPFYWDKEQ